VLVLALLGLGIALAWFYSAPPMRLHSRGLGELTTAIIVPLIVPLSGYSLQAGRLDTMPLLAVLPLCCFQFAMLLSIEFPDEHGDRASGKGTLVVRLGAERAARLYVAVLATGYALLPLLVLAGLPFLPALAVGLTLPLGVLQIYRMLRGDYRMPERWNSLAFGSVGLLIAAAALMAFAFLVLVGMG
jgi:1,4-dihydroxy-2-naphthoate octaprenyltransferase